MTSLSLLLEILANICIAIICLPVCDVIGFEIKLSFLIDPFLYMSKKSRQKSKYLENEKRLYGEIRLPAAKNYLRPKSWSLESSLSMQRKFKSMMM